MTSTNSIIFSLNSSDIDIVNTDTSASRLTISENLKTFLSDFNISEYEIKVAGVLPDSGKIEFFGSTALRVRGSEYVKKWAIETFRPFLILKNDHDNMVMKLAWEGR